MLVRNKTFREIAALAIISQAISCIAVECNFDVSEHSVSMISPGYGDRHTVS
jgi:hypothetical protein